MTDRWPKPSIALHWLGMLFLFGLAIAGFMLGDFPSDSASRLLLSRLHTAGGMSLMLLTAARFFIKQRSASIEPLPLSDFHRKGVQVVHGLLYALTFAIGLSGFLTGARSTWPDYLRGHLSSAPNLEAVTSRGIHEVLVFALFGLVALHVGGVLFQQLRQGGIIRRMQPF